MAAEVFAEAKVTEMVRFEWENRRADGILITIWGRSISMCPGPMMTPATNGWNHFCNIQMAPCALKQFGFFS